MTLPIDFFLDIHNSIKTRFGTVEDGRINKGRLESIAERPFLELHGQKIHRTVFEQAAVLMEGIIRGHPFTDGNKRTALAATYAFLSHEGYQMVIPLNILRYVVNIANNDSRDEESVDKLIKKIANWLEKRTATSQKEYDGMFKRYLYVPGMVFAVLTKSKIGLPIASLMFDYWMCTRHHPEYRKDLDKTVEWLLDLTKRSRESVSKQK